ncbi:probable Peptide methionine sulfoxide reductase [Zygosaccharomyces bailii ISA1307]|nr:probable Peptide methionine sulfoxide reductase [Zygosaccharomyces bailii ISA1307]
MVSTISKTIKFNSQTDKLLTVGAGCFWGTEHIYRKYVGDKIVDCKVGYANGSESKKDEPDSLTYKRVCVGDTGFCEVLQISYNPKIVSLKQLVDLFFKCHDPTTIDRQGPDAGTQYRSALFAHSDEDLKELKEMRQQWQPKWGNKIITQVELIKNFYDAEEYHQLYLDKNPEGYACRTHYIRDL